MCFLEGDQGAGEHQQGEVVLGLLRPAHEQAAVAVQPGMAGLDHPASRPPTGRLQLLRDLLAAAADVGRKAVVVDEPAALRVVVAGIEAETLG